MKYIGAHVSAAGGLANAPARAAEIGATAFAARLKLAQRPQRPLRFSQKTSVSGVPPPLLPRSLMTLKSPVKSIISRRRKSFPMIVT
ncbi:hypothetical protein LTSEMIN_3488 [Salmonella enterica subsp. enterica serovar Minnesota str. A4-603]|nr:hypothetical protein LTSEMIN_3488 [Salmonella enterica subsp. enterica serovar Minnesota str. A4-603]